MAVISEVIESRCIPLPLDNIDTNQIFPDRFVRFAAWEKEKSAERLFYDWRYLSDGKQNPDFVLNNPKFEGCVLVAGKNFGIGGNLEYAASAIADYGFKVVISSSFADDRHENELNNSVLPVVVSEEFLKDLFESVYADPSVKVRVDVPARTVTNLATGCCESF